MAGCAEPLQFFQGLVFLCSDTGPSRMSVTLKRATERIKPSDSLNCPTLMVLNLTSKRTNSESRIPAKSIWVILT